MWKNKFSDRLCATWLKSATQSYLRYAKDTGYRKEEGERLKRGEFKRGTFKKTWREGVFSNGDVNTVYFLSVYISYV